MEQARYRVSVAASEQGRDDDHDELGRIVRTRLKLCALHRDAFVAGLERAKVDPTQVEIFSLDDTKLAGGGC